MRGKTLPKSVLLMILATTAPTSTFLLGWSTMGRVAATSVARIYTDVNAKLGPSWHEYGEPGTICSV